MAKPKINKIREAILKNRGGFKNASDSQIMTIWNALSKETQEQYLKSIEKNS